MLAAIRPDSWNFPLFLHVVGAMILVAGTFAGVAMLALARGSAPILRVGYWSLLAVAFPGWVLMFASSHWIYEKEGLDEAPIESAWVAVGFVVAEAGGLLLFVSLVLGGIGVRRLRRDRGRGLLTSTWIISLVLLAAYVIAIWAMAAKPD